MEIATVILIVIASIVVLADLIVTNIVIRSTLFERRQKIFQCIFIWILPLLGAGIAYAVSREPKTKASGAYPKDSSLGDDPYVGTGDGAGDYFTDGHHDG